MERPLGHQTVVAEVVAMVGGEDDQRVVGEPATVEVIEDPPDVMVEQADHAVVHRDARPEQVARGCCGAT